MFNHALAFVLAVVATDRKSDEKGASAVEYAILVAAVIAIVGVAFAAFADDLTAEFEAIL